MILLLISADIDVVVDIKTSRWLINSHHSEALKFLAYFLLWFSTACYGIRNNAVLAA